MSKPYQEPSAATSERPTWVRYRVIFVATLAAVFLYLDRVSISEILADIESDLNLTAGQSDAMIGAFFFTYALAQVPGGWLSDLFGGRRMLTIYVLGWSICTVLTGLATSFWLLIGARLMFGITQAGAFPASSALLSKWAPVSARGIASSVVALGGRLGGTVAPKLTATLIALIVGSAVFKEWHATIPNLAPWRVTLLLYGTCGLLIALLCALIIRNRPAEHPNCNDAEKTLIDVGRPVVTNQSPVKLPVRAMLTNLSLWMMCLTQFMTNVGWAFLINRFPKYLQTVLNVSREDSGTMASSAWVAGIVGMLIGGFITDLATKKLGVRLGRTLPMAITRFVAAGACLICMQIDSPWGQTAAVAVMVFATDLGIGAMWAFAQDVGGKNAGAILGWGNMWGNFGAAVQPFMVTFALSIGSIDGVNNNWNAVFWMLSIAFVISGVASLFINAAVPLSSSDE